MTATPSTVPERAPWRSHGAPAAAPVRIGAVDVARGAALVAMAAYHLAWDLHAFGLTAVDPGRDPGWHFLGQAVACAFLGLSGFGLALARARGSSHTAAARRLLIVAAAASLVTLATWLLAPDAVVSFGILHCIVATNLMAMGLERLGSAPLTVLAGLALVAPQLVHLPGAWPWTGLSDSEPATLDFRPVLPWLGPVLLGLVAARTRIVPALAVRPPRGRTLGALAWAGRHSLALYLLHQPLMIMVLIAVAGAGSSPADIASTLRKQDEAMNFLHECGKACVKGGSDTTLCVATCHCVLTATINHSSRSNALHLGSWLRPRSPVTDAIAACQSGQLPPR